MKSNKSKALNNVFSVVLGVLSVAYVFPVFMILSNSLKKELSIARSILKELEEMAQERQLEEREKRLERKQPTR